MIYISERARRRAERRDAWLTGLILLVFWPVVILGMAAMDAAFGGGHALR